MLTVCRERKSARFVCRGTDYLEIGHLTHDFVIIWKSQMSSTNKWQERRREGRSSDEPFLIIF